MQGQPCVPQEGEEHTIPIAQRILTLTLSEVTCASCPLSLPRLSRGLPHSPCVRKQPIVYLPAELASNEDRGGYGLRGNTVCICTVRRGYVRSQMLNRRQGKSMWKTPFALQVFIPKDQHSRTLAPGRVCTDAHGSLASLSSLVCVLT